MKVLVTIYLYLDSKYYLFIYKQPIRISQVEARIAEEKKFHLIKYMNLISIRSIVLFQ